MSKKALRFISLMSTMTLLLFFAGIAMAQDAAVEQGALAYSNWTKTDAGGSGALPPGVDSQDYIRCKACHGWDHMATDGGYARRSRKDSRPNAGAGDGDTTSRIIVTGTVTADMITHTGTGRAYTDGMASWVALDDSHSAANKAAHANGYTLGNQHPDLSVDGLTPTQIDNLVAFLNFADGDSSVYFSNINPSQNPVLYTIVDTADAAAGETFYNSNCNVCHGDPATDHDGLNGGHPDGGILAYLAQDGKFSEFAHKARWGIPNTIMDRSTMGSPTSQNVADVMLYLQELGGTGFAINPGLSGNWWGGIDYNGEGFLIEIAYANDMLTLIGSFYTYDSEGAPEWLIATGLANTGTTSHVTIYISDAQRTWGSVGNPTNPATVEWGTGTFTFTSCTSGTFTFTPNATYMALGFTEITYDLQRDIVEPGIACPSINNEAP